MSETEGRQTEPSPAECHEELARLREQLVRLAGVLDDHAGTYYYLCGVLGSAPDGATRALGEAIGRLAADYVADWHAVADTCRRAEAVLALMRQRAEVEDRLSELESAADAG